MPEMETTTHVGNTTTHTRWWTGLFTLQNLFLIGTAIYGLVTFWNNQKNHSAHLDRLDSLIEVLSEKKADQADLNSLIERVNRQYETNNKIQDRIVAVEKAQEFERGYHKGLEDAKKP